MADFKAEMAARARLVGTFVKTASYEVVEVLALSGLDFICLDAEHAPFDRARLDACIAIARAKGLPCLVRVAENSAAQVLQALDMGADGIVVPHICSADEAAALVKSARFGHGGRGFAGSTRGAGWATRSMGDVLADGDKPIVIAQIEDPEGVEACEDIAATPGLDGLFLGPADLTVAYGGPEAGRPAMLEALARVGKAAAQSGKSYMTFVTGADQARDWAAHGVHMFFVGSEQGFMLAGARSAAASVKDA